eukprot:12960318-Alexandrium_andersonii.AAC.1
MGVIGRNTETVTSVSGQSELGAPNPAQGGRGPSMPNGPNVPLCGSDSAKAEYPLAALPGTGGAARSA